MALIQQVLDQLSPEVRSSLKHCKKWFCKRRAGWAAALFTHTSVTWKTYGFVLFCFDVLNACNVEVCFWENKGRNRANSATWSHVRQFVEVNQRHKESFSVWRVSEQIKRDIDKIINAVEMKSICTVMEAMQNQALYQENIIHISVARYHVLRTN